MKNKWGFLRQSGTATVKPAENSQETLELRANGANILHELDGVTMSKRIMEV